MDKQLAKGKGVADRQYEDLLAKILDSGNEKADRTGTGTRSLFGAQLRYNLADSFPLITTKRVFMRGVAEELFWFLSGTSNVRPLQEKKVHIWDDWADAEGELGPVYGVQWRYH
nr:Thymidylate synthase [uncultured bacterium]